MKLTRSAFFMIVTLTGILTAGLACGSSDDAENPPATGGSNTGGSTADGAADAPVSSDCDKLLAREVKCNPGVDSAKFTEECKQLHSCHEKALVSGFTTPFWECAVARECGVSDDSCAEDEAKALASEPTRKAAFDACVAKKTSCPGVFSDDVCMFAALSKDNVGNQIGSCLHKDCTEIDACLAQVFESVGCKK